MGVTSSQETTTITTKTESSPNITQQGKCASCGDEIATSSALCEGCKIQQEDRDLAMAMQLSQVMYDSKSNRVNESHTDSDSDYAEQETIVNDDDLREHAYKFDMKNKNILACIGKLTCRFMDGNNNKKSKYGTATVFNVVDNNAYIITCAHNIRMSIYICNQCNTENTKIMCPTCATKQFSVLKNIVEAGKIYFERRNIETGAFEQRYNCDMNNIYMNDDEYKRFPTATGGYDIAVLTFTNKNGYYSKICQDILLVDAKTFFNFQKALPKNNSYYIFGFPHTINANENHQLYGSESINDEFECVPSKTGKFYLKQNEIDTSMGTSGAAIFSVLQGPDNIFYALIFAIHSGGKMTKTFNYNVGTLVSRNLNTDGVKSMDQLINDAIQNSHFNFEELYATEPESKHDIDEKESIDTEQKENVSIDTVLNDAPVKINKEFILKLAYTCAFLVDRADDSHKLELDTDTAVRSLFLLSEIILPCVLKLEKEIGFDWHLRSFIKEYKPLNTAFQGDLVDSELAMRIGKKIEIYVEFNERVMKDINATLSPNIVIKDCEILNIDGYSTKKLSTHHHHTLQIFYSKLMEAPKQITKIDIINSFEYVVSALQIRRFRNTLSNI